MIPVPANTQVWLAAAVKAQAILIEKLRHQLAGHQAQIFDREGIDLDRSTLADWVGKTTALLEPLADAIGRHVLSAEAIFADDTPISMLAPGTGKTHTARLWTQPRDEGPWGGGASPAAWYRFSGDRTGQHPKDHLGRYRGWMRADGYAGLYRSGAIRDGRKAPRPQKRPSAGTRNSVPSRRRPGDHHRITGPAKTHPCRPGLR